MKILSKMISKSMLFFSKRKVAFIIRNNFIAEQSLEEFVNELADQFNLERELVKFELDNEIHLYLHGDKKDIKNFELNVKRLAIKYVDKHFIKKHENCSESEIFKKEAFKRTTFTTSSGYVKADFSNRPVMENIFRYSSEHKVEALAFIIDYKSVEYVICGFDENNAAFQDTFKKYLNRLRLLK